MKWKLIISKLDLWILGATALIGAGLTVISFFDVPGSPWAKEHLVSGAMALATLSAVLVATLLIRLEQIASALAGLKSQLDLNTLESLTNLRAQVDPNLEIVYGDYLTSVVANMQGLIKDRTLVLTDLDVFRSVYKRALAEFTGATFSATSSPSVLFFWSGPSILQAMKEFIQKGGTIRRIFFLESESDFQNQEIRQVLTSQANIGVEVYTVLTHEVGGDFQKYVMVDSKKRIGWELSLGPGGKIACAKLSSNPGALDHATKVFNHIFQLDSTTRFVP